MDATNIPSCKTPAHSRRGDPHTPCTAVSGRHGLLEAVAKSSEPAQSFLSKITPHRGLAEPGPPKHSPNNLAARPRQCLERRGHALFSSGVYPAPRFQRGYYL